MYICPVCGYDKLDEPPYNKFSNASCEICVSCGIEFGYNDCFLNVKEDCWKHLRNEWINNGMVYWASYRIETPKDYNPIEQLLNIGIIYENYLGENKANDRESF